MSARDRITNVCGLPVRLTVQHNTTACGFVYVFVVYIVGIGKHSRVLVCSVECIEFNSFRKKTVYLYVRFSFCL